MVFKKLEEIKEEFRIRELVVCDKYFLDGKLNIWDGDFYEVVSPIKERDENGNLKDLVIGKFPLMNKEIVLDILDESYKAYNKGFGEWACFCYEERIEYFEKFIENLKKYREDCIKVLMWEIAKNHKDATTEFDRTIKYIEDTLEEFKKISRESIPKLVGNLIAQVKRSPLGVTLVMGPYNYPLNETFATIIPALLMGNTVIVKPPKRGALIYKYVVEAANGVFPKGVFNVVYGRGSEVVTPIMESGKISVFAFIGSHKTANLITKMHPKPNRLKLIFGLDAKNVGIIMNDADLDLTLQETITGTLSYNGQRCTALKMLYVDKKISDKFLSKFVEKVDGLNMGLPFDNPNITPCPDERISYFNELVEDALSKGAKIINTPKKDEASFFSPKVLLGVTKDMRIYHEEQFGPIIPIVEYENLEEPIEYILSSNYGQQCSIFGRNSDKIGHLVDFLTNQVSRVNINAQCQRGPDVLPFTGRKDSAVGTLSVSDALKEFSIKTLVTLKKNKEDIELYKELNSGKSKFLKHEILF